MILYGLPISTYCAKVRIALGIKDIDYTMKPPPGGYRSSEYKKIAPLGTIPALKCGDFCLSESDVLIEYLDEIHPEPALLFGSAAERAHQRFVARYHDLWLEPHLRRTFAYVAVESRPDTGLTASLDSFQERVQLMESLVEPAPYLCGETLSVADCSFPATLTLAETLFPVFGREILFGAKLLTWRETIYAHPVVKKIINESREATREWLVGCGR